VDDAYSGRIKLFMCEVNIAEFLYSCAKVLGWEAALARHSLLRNSPIEVVGVDEKLTVEARASVPAYSLSFSLTFSLEKITFGLFNIEFIKPRFALSPCTAWKTR
jgi:hypothetical protein